jgi:serine/threonine protein kinase
VSASADAPRRKYRDGARIGGGGMAEVFRSTVTGVEGFERPVAIKRILPSVSNDPRFAAMFVNEARISAMLHHPNIVQVLDFDRDDDGRLFLVMELVDGMDLATLMQRGPVPVGVAVYIVSEVLKALAYAHDLADPDGKPLRIVHRDVSPHNVLLSRDGAVKLADFGIAKALGAAGAETSELLKGKPLYMAPEQVTDPGSVDHRADLFAVGATLHELLTGRRVYRGSTADEILTDVVQVARRYRDLERVSDLGELGTVLHGLLHVDRETRLAHAHAAASMLATAGLIPTDGALTLAAHVRHEATRPRPLLARPGMATDDRLMRAETRTRAPRRRAPNVRLAGAAVAAALIVAVATLVWSSRSHSGEPGAMVPAGAGSWDGRSPDRRLTSYATHDFYISWLRFSPDGKRLALVHDGRLTIEDLTSGEKRDLTPPNTRFSLASWFPDGQRLLVCMHNDSAFDVGVLQLTNGAIHSLGFGGWFAEPSRHGTLIATTDGDGLWVSGADGVGRRRLVSRADVSYLGAPSWSPDDQWIIYGSVSIDGKESIRAASVHGPTRSIVLNATDSRGAYWTTDGRLIYASAANEEVTLQAVALDPATAQPRGPTTLLTTIHEDVQVYDVSRDGRRVLYGRGTPVRARYVGLLGANELQGLHTADHQEWTLIGSSADDAITYYSTSTTPGRSDVLAVDPATPVRVLASVPGTLVDAAVVPDGGAVLYLQRDERAGKLSLARADATGRPPVELDVLPYDNRIALGLSCARRPGATCVLGTVEGSDAVLYEVDPQKGRGRIIARLAGAAPPWHFDLSADGRHLVVTQTLHALQTIDVASGDVHDVAMGLPAAFGDATWIGNSDSLLVDGGTPGVSTLLRIDPGQPPRQLWTSTSERIAGLRVSNDGTQLDMRTSAYNTNFWLLTAPDD